MTHLLRLVFAVVFLAIGANASAASMPGAGAPIYAYDGALSIASTRPVVEPGSAPTRTGSTRASSADGTALALVTSVVAPEEGVTVYRGTSITSELQIHAETGQLMSDAARVGCVESGGSIEAAQTASEAAHQAGIQAWGSEAAYAEAHTEFGTELSQIGPRSMISVTTDPAVAKLFAGPGGSVFSAVVNPSMLIPGGASESEFLIAHMFGAL